MRHYLWTFIGLMLIVSSGGCKTVGQPVQFDVEITNNCPGNMLQLDIVYSITYLCADPNKPSASFKKTVANRLNTKQTYDEYIADGADVNGDGLLDSGDLNNTPPATDALYITLDYLDADNDPNDIWVASTNTIHDGSAVKVTIDESCLASYQILSPALAGIRDSSTQSGVFRRVDSTLPQVID